MRVLLGGIVAFFVGVMLVVLLGSIAAAPVMIQVPDATMHPVGANARPVAHLTGRR